MGSNPILPTNAEMANDELAESLVLGTNNLEGSTPSLSTMDGLSMVRQLVLKTRIRCNSRGFDTSALRNMPTTQGRDGSVKPLLEVSNTSGGTMESKALR